MPPLQPWVLIRAPVLPHLLRQEPCIPTRTLPVFLAVPPFTIIAVAVGLRVDACPRPHARPTVAHPLSAPPLVTIQLPPAPLIYAPHLQSLPLDSTASFLRLKTPAQHPRPRPMPPAHPLRSPYTSRLPVCSGNSPSPICHIPSCPRHPVTPHARVLRPGPHSPSPAPSWPPSAPTQAQHNRSTLSPNSSLLSLVRPEKQPRHV